MDRRQRPDPAPEPDPRKRSGLRVCNSGTKQITAFYGRPWAALFCNNRKGGPPCRQKPYAPAIWNCCASFACCSSSATTSPARAALRIIPRCRPPSCSASSAAAPALPAPCLCWWAAGLCANSRSKPAARCRFGCRCGCTPCRSRCCAGWPGWMSPSAHCAGRRFPPVRASCAAGRLPHGVWPGRNFGRYGVDVPLRLPAGCLPAPLAG